MTPCCFLLVLLFLYKMKVGEALWRWEEYGQNKIFLFFMSLCPILSQIFQEWVERSEKDVGYNPAAAIVFLLVLYIIFLYVGQKEMQRKRIEEQTVSLRQQMAYIQNLEELQGGNGAQNARITTAILKGEERGARREIVLLNAGAALCAGGRAATIKEGIVMAAESIDSGKAYHILEELVKISNEPSAA